MLDQSLKNRLIDRLMDLPGIEDRETRNTLLTGIRVPLNRSNNHFVDVTTMVNQLDCVGRLDNGERPVVIIAHNAARMVRGTQLGRNLQDLERDIEVAYGGEELAPDIPTVPEALVFGGPGEWVTSVFLEQAMLAGTRVARIRVPKIVEGDQVDSVGALGTGWLIAPRLLLTNHHVVNARRQGEPAALSSDFNAQGRNLVAWFDYKVEGGSNTEIAVEDLVCAKAALDYALLRLSDHESLPGRRQMSLPQNAPSLDRGSRLNVVQYPGGGPLRLAIRNNFFIGRGTKTFQIRYLTDTIEGSSGSPVLDDNWQVVALHHGAQKIDPHIYTADPGVQGIAKFHNQGIDIHAIMDDLPKEVAKEIRAAQGWS
jgi:V8-like Glu-specific endopeptidase